MAVTTQADEPLHRPRIFLATSIVQAGCDMIGLIGELKGDSRGGDDFDAGSWTMVRLRDAVDRASRALRNYHCVVADDRKFLTSSQFEQASAEATHSVAAELREIAEAHLPDQPADSGGDELVWAKQHIAKLRALAQSALSKAERL